MSVEQIKQQVARCIAELRAGELAEASLQGILAALDEPPPQRQELLYLQATTTSVTSDVVGMLLVQDGEVSEGPADPDEWPYPTVLAAMQDGWRVIRFPDLVLTLDESRSYGLGYEFILEKWR